MGLGAQVVQGRDGIGGAFGQRGGGGLAFGAAVAALVQAQHNHALAHQLVGNAGQEQIIGRKWVALVGAALGQQHGRCKWPGAGGQAHQPAQAHAASRQSQLHGLHAVEGAGLGNGSQEGAAGEQQEAEQAHRRER